MPPTPAQDLSPQRPLHPGGWGLSCVLATPLLLPEVPCACTLISTPTMPGNPSRGGELRVFIADIQKSCHPHLFTQQRSPSWTLTDPPATDRPSSLPHLFFPPHLILHHLSFQNKLPQTSRAHSGPESLTESPLQPQPPHWAIGHSHQTQPSPSAASSPDLEAAAPALAGF